MRVGSSPVSAAALSGLSATSPTLTTDQFDYHPGDTITISGSGWESGEGISMVLSVDPSTHPDVNLTSVADEDGNFTNADYVVQRTDLGVVFTLTATGESSGTVRTAGFTDSGEGLAQVTNVTPTDGGCVFQDSLPANATEQWDVEAGKTYTVTLTNVSDAANGGTDPTMQVIVKSTDTGNECLTATKQSTGVYTFSVTLPDNACNTMPIL